MASPPSSRWVGRDDVKSSSSSKRDKRDKDKERSKQRGAAVSAAIPMSASVGPSVSVGSAFYTNGTADSTSAFQSGTSARLANSSSLGSLPHTGGSAAAAAAAALSTSPPPSSSLAGAGAASPSGLSQSAMPSLRLTPPGTVSGLSLSPRHRSSSALSSSTGGTSSLTHSSSFSANLASLDNHAAKSSSSSSSSKSKRNKLKDVLTDLKSKKKSKASDSSTKSTSTTKLRSTGTSTDDEAATTAADDGLADLSSMHLADAAPARLMSNSSAGGSSDRLFERAASMSPSSAASPASKASASSSTATAAPRHKRTLSKSISDNNLLGLVTPTIVVGGVSTSGDSESQSDWLPPPSSSSSVVSFSAAKDHHHHQQQQHQQQQQQQQQQQHRTRTSSDLSDASASDSDHTSGSSSSSARNKQHQLQQLHQFQQQRGGGGGARKQTTPHHVHLVHGSTAYIPDVCEIDANVPSCPIDGHDYTAATTTTTSSSSSTNHHQHLRQPQQQPHGTRTARSYGDDDSAEYYDGDMYEYPDDDEDDDDDEDSIDYDDDDEDEDSFSTSAPARRPLAVTTGHVEQQRRQQQRQRALQFGSSYDDHAMGASADDEADDALDIVKHKPASISDDKPPLPFLADVTRVSAAYAKGMQPDEGTEDSGSMSRYARLLALPRMAAEGIHSAGSNFTNLPKLAGQGIQKASEGIQKAGTNFTNLPKLAGQGIQKASEGIQKAGTNIASLPKLAGEGIQRAGSGIQKAGANIVNLPISLTENMKQHMNANDRSFWPRSSSTRQAHQMIDESDVPIDEALASSTSIIGAISPSSTPSSAALGTHRNRSLSSNADPRQVLERNTSDMTLSFVDDPSRRRVAGEKRNRKDLKQMKETLEGLEKNVHSSMVEQLEDLGDDIEQHIARAEENLQQFITEEMIRVHESNEDVLKNIARVNKKLEETFHNLDTYARRMKMLEDRLISIQRRQAMQVTIFDILFMLLNWLVLGLTFLLRIGLWSFDKARVVFMGREPSLASSVPILPRAPTANRLMADPTVIETPDPVGDESETLWKSVSSAYTQTIIQATKDMAAEIESTLADSSRASSTDDTPQSNMSTDTPTRVPTTASAQKDRREAGGNQHNNDDNTNTDGDDPSAASSASIATAASDASLIEPLSGMNATSKSTNAKSKSKSKLKPVDAGAAVSPAKQDRNPSANASSTAPNDASANLSASDNPSYHRVPSAEDSLFAPESLSPDNVMAALQAASV